MFASWAASSLARSLASADPDLCAGASSNGSNSISGTESKPYDPMRLEKLEDMLKRYEEYFGKHLRILMDRLLTPAVWKIVQFWLVLAA